MFREEKLPVQAKEDAEENAESRDRRRALGAETRRRVLLAAEKLFAKNGYNGAGMREIAREAEANVAALHYHFGSKQALLCELLQLRGAPIAKQRMERLAEMRKSGPLDLPSVLRAFLEPAFLDDPSGPLNHSPYAELRARLSFESEAITRQVLSEIFDESSRAYIAAIAECLPGLPEEDLYFKFHFMLSTMFYAMLNTGRVTELSGGKTDTSDPRKLLDHLIPFLVVGFRDSVPEAR
ncbi:MAG: TetR/AcrR family transcriptional regulator [Pseudorhodoplanes sp.]